MTEQHWDREILPPDEGFESLKSRIKEREQQGRSLRLTLLTLAFVVAFLFPPDFSRPMSTPDPGFQKMEQQISQEWRQLVSPPPLVFDEEKETYIKFHTLVIQNDDHR